MKVRLIRMNHGPLRPVPNQTTGNLPGEIKG